MPAAAKYALSHLFVQAEFGLCCPVSMTDSLARTLRKFGAPELVDKVLPQVTSLDFDSLRQARHVHDRAGRGLRCQRHRGRGRGAAGRQLAS